MHACNRLNIKLALACALIVLASATASVSSKAQNTQAPPATTGEQVKEKLPGQVQQQQRGSESGESESQTKANTARIKKFVPSQQIEADTAISLPSNI